MVTGQEAVETTKCMREDLYKKHMSADPVPCRMPYAIVTKLVELVGWKRFEMNKLMRFTGVSEDSFPSLMRRSLCIELKSVFKDPEIIMREYAGRDAAALGVFPRDPTLKEFLKSGPAVAASLRLLHGFLGTNSEEDCRRIIESYVEHGVDRGLTRALLRKACGLSLELKPAAQRAQVAPTHRAGCEPAPAFPFQEQRERADLPPAERSLREMRDELQADHVALIQHMLKRNEDYMILTAAGRLTAGVWQHLPNADARKRRFDDLIQCGLWQTVGCRKAIKQACVPVFTTEKMLHDIVDIKRPDQCDRSYPELFDHLRFSKHWMSPTEHENRTTMVEHYRARIAALTRKGRLPVDARKCKDDAIEAMGKLESHLVHMDKLYKELTLGQARTVVKYIEAGRSYELIRKSAVYEYKNDLRSRRYAVGSTYQVLPRAVRRKVMPECLIDYDIQAAQWTFLSQLLNRLKITFPPGVEGFNFIHAYAAAPYEVRKSLNTKAGRDVKPLLLAILNGGSIPDDLQDCRDLIQLRNESRMLRWLVASAYPAAVAQATADGRPWPEATAVFYAWTAGEDVVLEAWASFVSARSAAHLSLHWDGLLVDRRSVGDEAIWLSSVHSHIESTTGFKVTIRRKDVNTFLDLVRSCASTVDVPDRQELTSLTMNGNCIPCSLAHLTESYKHFADLCDRPCKENLDASRMGYRSYESLCSSFEGLEPRFRSLRMNPEMGLHVHKARLSLLHVEANNKGHCVACRYDGAGRCVLYDGREAFSISLIELEACGHEAADQSEIATLNLLDNVSPDDASMRLLSLLAGVGGEEQSRDLDSQGQSPRRRVTAKRSPVSLPVKLNSVSSNLDSQGQCTRRRITAKMSPVDLPYQKSMASSSSCLSLERPSASTSSGSGLGLKRPSASKPVPSVVSELETPSDLLVKALREEVEGLELQASQLDCPFCPFRGGFQKQNRLRKHIASKHVYEKAFFCAGSTKQFRLVLALWDNDCLVRQRSPTRLLQRSADLLRCSVSPTLSKKVFGTEFDRMIRLVLDSTGARYVHAEHIEEQVGPVRCIGHYMYTQAFATLVFKEAVLAKGSIRETQSRVAQAVSLAGSELASLLPVNVKTWEKIVEDVMFSDAVVTMFKGLIREGFLASCFRHISVDCTFRAAFALIGQCSYRAPKRVRAQQAIPEEEMEHAICTIRGATGAVLEIALIPTESSEAISELCNQWVQEYRGQVQHITTDNPSRRAFDTFLATFPNLRSLSLDLMHIVFRYEQAFWKKRTKGSTMLRKLVAKLFDRTFTEVA